MKNVGRHLTTILMTSAFLSGTLATSAFAEPERVKYRQVKDKDNIVAALHLKDGSVVQFHEPAPGLVAVVAHVPIVQQSGDKAHTINGISIRQLDHLKALEQYRLLSGGQQAPAALVQAQQRADQAKRARSSSSAPSSVPSVGAPTHDPANGSRTRAEVTPSTYGDGDWFKSNFCPASGFSFEYCWLYRTGNGWVQRDADWIDSIAYPYRGNINLVLKYETCVLFFCDWHTFLNDTVLEGTYVWHSASGSFTYRAELNEGDGDGWHWSVYGG